jgi:SET domain
MIFVEETDNRFYIEKSTIPNAGNGCFAKEFLKAGDWLEVIGIYVKMGGVADFCTEYARRYKFAGSEQMNAKIVPFGFAGIINHSNDPKLQNCKLEYVKGLSKRSQHAGQVIYRFIKDIEPNEELIGNYGPDMEKEIGTIAANDNFYENNKQEIENFLKFNLYDLNTIVKSL